MAGKMSIRIWFSASDAPPPSRATMSITTVIGRRIAKTVRFIAALPQLAHKNRSNSHYMPDTRRPNAMYVPAMSPLRAER